MGPGLSFNIKPRHQKLAPQRWAEGTGDGGRPMENLSFSRVTRPAGGTFYA